MAGVSAGVDGLLLDCSSFCFVIDTHTHTRGDREIEGERVYKLETLHF
jgi:hypothetical protein